MRRRTFLFPFHPILFAIHPILYCFARGVDMFSGRSMVVPIGFTLIAVSMLWLALKCALHDVERAALVVSLAVVLFFSYGHAYNALWAAGLSVRHRWLLLAWAAVFAVGCWQARRTRRLSQRTWQANIVALILLAMPVGQLSWNSFQSAVATQEPLSGRNVHDAQPLPTEPLRQSLNKPSQPDIYYVILDAYSSAPVLKEFFGFDNSSFLRALARRGFYVANRSRANYSNTGLSIPCSLNMNYLQPHSTAGERLEGIRHNEVRQFLEEIGYRYVALNPLYDYLDADFQMALIGTTAMLPAANVYKRLYHSENARGNTLEVFQRLAKVARHTQPVFVYAHIYCPHEPYVFGPHGERVSPEMRARAEKNSAIARRLYVDQVQFLNQKVLEWIDLLLETSDPRPMIILQGDHGSGIGIRDWQHLPESQRSAAVRERMGILNAYLVPDPVKKDLYETITPVNTFRLILSRYFGANYHLLEDRVYYSHYRNPWALELVE